MKGKGLLHNVTFSFIDKKSIEFHLEIMQKKKNINFK